jgi:cbb3-type cytochrome oxidase maturation protein
MTAILFLLPIALIMASAGLLAFLWCVRTGQYDDIEGAAARILLEDDD